MTTETKHNAVYSMCRQCGYHGRDNKWGDCRICGWVAHTDAFTGEQFASLMLALGLRRKTTARLLGLSPATVSSYRQSAPKSALVRLRAVCDPVLSLREQKLKSIPYDPRWWMKPKSEML